MMYPNTECPHDCYKPGDCDGSCTHPLSEESIQTSDSDNEWAGFHTNPARPVVAPQQPRAVQPAAPQPADAFRNMFAILHNVAMWDLEEAGIIRKGDDDKWTRFNNDLTTFVLKLDDARLDALYALITSRQPERYRGIV